METNYDKAKALMAEVTEWAEQGFPGASLEDLVKMTSHEPEHHAAVARVRAEINCGLMLAAMPVKESLDKQGVTDPELRLALYKSRMGVRKGSHAYQLMEVQHEVQR